MLRNMLNNKLNSITPEISGLISTVVKDTSVMGVDRSLKKSIGTIDELAQMIKLDYDEYDALVLTLKVLFKPNPSRACPREGGQELCTFRMNSRGEGVWNLALFFFIFSAGNLSLSLPL